jgi:DNA invertase Pin-like site-specific DNA recombinase
MSRRFLVADKKRVAVYSRVARDNPTALEAQEKDCAEWAQRAGMEVTQTYRSVGPDDLLLDLLRDIAAGRVDAVVATNSHRYSWHSDKLQLLTDTARKHGVRVFTVELDDLDLASEPGYFRLTLAGLSEDYEKERAQAEERVRKSRE